MYAREYRSTRPHKAIFFHLSCLTLICSAQVYAKPDMRPLGPNIADKGSVFYHFSVTSFDSVDGTRQLSGMDGRAEYNRTGIGLPDFIYA